jgi:hypothetical protein
MLNVVTWLWRQPRGRTEYNAEHVNIWAAMLSRHLLMPHKVSCVTDMSDGIDGSIEIIAPPGDFLDITNPRWSPRQPQCYRRLSMFRRDAADIFGERFVCMDLDCVIAGPLDPLFDRPDDLVLFKGTSRTRPYNGSMMLIRAGSRPEVFEDFSPAGAMESGRQFVGSDQAWLAHKLGWSEATWDDGDGVSWFGSAYRRRRERPRLLFFPGGMKPWDAARLDPFVAEHYRLELQEAA